MTTYSDLIEDVLGYCNSFGLARDKVTTLTQTIGASDTTFTVSDAKQVDRGYVEIDSEMMLVASVDTGSNTVTVHPWGRGQRGTTAAAHTSGTMITDTPRFPRGKVKEAITQAISNLYPDLFWVGSDESQSVQATRVTYSVPAAVESIVSVSYKSTGPSQRWVPVTRYRLDYNADVTSFPTGRSLDIYQAMQPGRTIKIVYRGRFGAFSSEADTLASINVPDDYRDIIRSVAVARLLMGLDPARIELDTVEATQRAALVQPLQATQIARQYMAEAQMRTAQERRELLLRYPSTQVRNS